MSLSLHEQLKLHIEDPLEFDNIYPHDCWTLEEYKEFFKYIEKRWILQSWDHYCGFIVNQEWEGDPLWTPAEEVYNCETCDKEVKDEHYGLSYGCLSVSLCKQCYEKEKS